MENETKTNLQRLHQTQKAESLACFLKHIITQSLVTIVKQLLAKFAELKKKKRKFTFHLLKKVTDSVLVFL